MVEDFCDLARLIRSLQRLEGHPDCFGTAEQLCERSECAWREYCLKPEGGPAFSPEGDSEPTDHPRSGKEEIS
jgi:hypothetical protein